MNDGFTWVRLKHCLVNVSLGLRYAVLSTGGTHSLVLYAAQQVVHTQPHTLQDCPTHEAALALLDKFTAEVGAKRYD